MKRQRCIFTLPILSDEAAYDLMKVVQNLCLELESHFMHQLRRYSIALDNEDRLRKFKEMKLPTKHGKDEAPPF